ncbi:MAG: DUF4180 domain-containing protein [Candidatus Cryosericum sp.]|nr:DUF4180 domain-containing protein [Candidatus Cryosericum sp.]
MTFERVDKNGKAYVKVTDGEIATEQDGLTLIAACIERSTNLAMLPKDCLSQQFLQLSTRVAGVVVEKLEDYGIRAVALLNIESASPRFREFALESNHSTTFHVCETVDEAEQWLLEERTS